MSKFVHVAVAATWSLALGAGSAAAQSFVATAGVPSGFALSGNTLGLSLSGSYGQPRSGPGSTRLDASSALSFGIGDPIGALGLQSDVNLTSFRRFGASGYASFTAHRMFQTNSSGVFSVALSLTHVAPWGDSAALPVGGSLIGSYLFGFDGRLAMATVGVANNLNDRRRVEPVLGLGLGITDNWAANLGWAGNQSVVGATWRPNFMGGFAVSISLRALENDNRRMVGIDLTRAF
jgi:hypothetical protein